MPFGSWFTYISYTRKSIIISIFLISRMHILYLMQSIYPLPWLQYRSLYIKTIKDLLQPIFRSKVQHIQPIYMYISVRPKGHILKKSQLWCFYSVHLKPLWKIPNSSRDILYFCKLFSLRKAPFLALLRHIWMISDRKYFRKFAISLDLFGIFQSGLR